VPVGGTAGIWSLIINRTKQWLLCSSRICTVEVLQPLTKTVA